MVVQFSKPSAFCLVPSPPAKSGGIAAKAAMKARPRARILERVSIVSSSGMPGQGACTRSFQVYAWKDGLKSYYRLFGLIPRLGRPFGAFRKDRKGMPFF